MKLTACIEWLFADETDDFAERIVLAKKAGMAGVEFHHWENKPVDEVISALADTGLTLTSHIVEPRRSLVDPAQHDEVITAVINSARSARRLGTQNLVIASGFTLEGISEDIQYANVVKVLAQAAKIAADEGVTLLLEPLNDIVDHPGMYLVSVRKGLDIVEQIGSPGLKLVYDAYHSILMGECPTETISGRLDLIAHVQLADHPGRGAPGTGGLDFDAILKPLNDGGYDGFYGLEYKLNGLSTRETLNITYKALGLGQSVGRV